MKNKILKLISKYDEIVIARHIGPDPDAVASQIGLRDSIKLTYPKKKVYAVGTHVSRFKFLGNLDKVNENELTNALLIVVDNPNIERLDSVDISKYEKIVLIDHHPKEDLFDMAAVTYVDETSSSAAQLVADIIINSRLKMTNEIAGCLFVGIVADSDRFLLGYTNYKTFRTVSKLMKYYDFDKEYLYSKLYERPFAEVKFQGYIANNLEVSDNNFGSIILEEKTIKEMGVDSSSASNMVNDFNYIKELIVWAFASYDTKGKVYKINIRSRGPIVNEIASKYNGGGHKLASGARLEDIKDVKKLFKELDELCHKYLNKDKNENK